MGFIQIIGIVCSIFLLDFYRHYNGNGSSEEDGNFKSHKEEDAGPANKDPSPSQDSESMEKGKVTSETSSNSKSNETSIKKAASPTPGNDTANETTIKKAASPAPVASNNTDNETAVKNAASSSTSTPQSSSTTKDIDESTVDEAPSKPTVDEASSKPTSTADHVEQSPVDHDVSPDKDSHHHNQESEVDATMAF